LALIDNIQSLMAGGASPALSVGASPVPPQMIQNPDGSVEFVDVQGDTPTAGQHLQDEFYENLAEGLDERALCGIGHRILCDFDIDWEALEQRRQDGERALQLLGFHYDETSDPFEGACNAVHPILAQHVITYQSKAIVEIFPANGPVRTKIVGNPTPAKQDQAQRVQEFMNYELTEQIPEFFDEQERLLFGVGLMGTGFKKNWFDPARGRLASAYVPDDRLIVPIDATSLETAARFFEIMPVSIPDMASRIAKGYYVDPDIVGGPAQSGDESRVDVEIRRQQGMDSDISHRTEWEVIEAFYYLDPVEDCDDKDNADAGTLLPYVVTLERSTGRILAIRRNWRKADPDRRIRVWHTPYYFVKGPGFYGYGLYHLIGGYADTITSSQRQLVDAGTFANLRGGWRSRGLRTTGDQDDPIRPGEFREVETTAGDLQKSILPFNYAEPSQTLLNLIVQMTKDASTFADSTDQIVGNSSTYGPVGTIVALLEQSSRLQNALHKRIHRSQGQELAQIKELNYEVLPPVYPYDVANAPRTIFKSDFNGGIGIIPASDPNIFSQSQRLAIAQAKQALIQQMSADPQMTPWKRNSYREVLVGMGEENPDMYLPPEQKPQAPPPPMDPISEQQALLRQQPVQAYPQQDHAAHVQALLAFLQDPQYTVAMEMVGPAAQALLFSHLAFLRGQEVQAQLGLPQPQPGQPMPPPVQAHFDQMAAKVITGLAQARPPSLANPLGQGAIDPIQQQKLEIDRMNAETSRGTLLEKQSHNQAATAYKWAHTAAQGQQQDNRLIVQGRIAASNQAIKRAELQAKGINVEE